MTEQMLTIEQEAAQVLERMAWLRQENQSITMPLLRELDIIEGQAQRLRENIAEINAERTEALAELEERAKGLGLRAEQTIKTEHGAIKFRAGYLRVSYDAKSLDAVSKTPEHGWVRQYRRESSVAPSAKVNVEESA